MISGDASIYPVNEESVFGRGTLISSPGTTARWKPNRFTSAVVHKYDRGRLDRRKILDRQNLG